jgi:hypothetical protein
VHVRFNRDAHVATCVSREERKCTFVPSKDGGGRDGWWRSGRMVAVGTDGGGRDDLAQSLICSTSSKSSSITNLE